MKFALVNLSGNIGKTTIAVNLLKPRMNDAPIFSVESINMGAEASGQEVEKMKGKKFGDLVDKLMMLDSAIIDVGASNVDDFLKMMQQFDGSHEEFDRFIIPVIKDEKVIGDTINTIKALETIGVEKERIFLVFNKVDVEDSVRDEFSALFGYATIANSFTLNENAVIFANEVYERAISSGKSVGNVLDDSTDYRAKLREAKTNDEKENCIRMIGMKRLAVTAKKNLDVVFEAVTA